MPGSSSRRASSWQTALSCCRASWSSASDWEPATPTPRGGLTLYSLITIYITSRVIAYLLNGASYDKLLFIISDHHQALKRFIIEDLDRSATYIKSKGMYTDASRDMIFLVVSRKEVHLVQHKIKEIDPAAFVVVTDAYETFGEGFKQFPDKNEIHAE